MKRRFFSMSFAALLASTSTIALASNVTVPNTFASGTPAVAADVNANFDTVAAGVNDNDSRITTNTTAVGANTTNITTNTDATAANAANITANAANITTNTTAIATLQAGPGCPAGMAPVGSLCVDIYEASVWSDDTGGIQFGLPVDGDNYPCVDDGSDCGAGAANPIYARSEAGQTPSAFITWYQAVQACANVGKRLPTTAEWQMAASGTPSGLTNGCNVDGGPLAASGSFAACVSSTGNFDMVGNLWEWAAELDIPAQADRPDAFENTDNAIARMMGQDKGNSGGGTPSTKSMLVLDGNGGGFDNGPNSDTDIMGFRCVR